MASSDLVLVTGGSGFVGSHCILLLLERGYRVRTTVRSLSRSDRVRQMLEAGGASSEKVQGVEFVAADLSSDGGWTEASGGCSYVLHVASPLPAFDPKNEDDLIVPTREGTLRALRAAKAAGTVKRVVVTSSVSAVGYGHADRGAKPFTEEDWTVLEKPLIPITAYHKSKTLAERAAWDFIEKDGGEMELAVVNPVGIFGPILAAKDYATSIELVVRLMNGQLPGLPQLSMGIVDVRDVADLHLRCMIDPKAAGQRFLAIAGDYLTMHGIAMALKNGMGDKANKVPTRLLPNFLLRILGFFDPTVALIVPELGKYKNASGAKAERVLGWQPRSAQEALVGTAESLEKFGLLK
ncbi:hypothetical protein LTR08_001293 [Meristemomyces frigidus]|nr:hypothetical protein LTR08_001293 [Meristemomyces frigidus]